MKTNSSSIPAGSARSGLDAAFSEIRKQFGDGSIVRLAAAQFPKVEALSTGSLAIDVALGIGGLPRGRIVEIFGPESSGKTTLCLSVIAQAQRAGGTAAIIDVEHALDFGWAKTCGVDVGSLVFGQPDCGEDALNIAEKLIGSKELDVLIIDSVAALVPKAELEGQVGDVTVGALARLMSQAMRRFAGLVAKTRCVCILTNQIREKIGVMYGPTEYQPGGRALKFFSSVRLDLRRKETQKSAEGVATGNRVKVKVVKNKVAVPYAECEVDLAFDEGISNAGTLLDLGHEHRLIEKKGAWFAYKGVLIGQGREAARAHIRATPALAAELSEALKGKILSPKTEKAAEEKAA